MATAQETRIWAAAGRLAWAYVLFQGNGDLARAPAALFAFQNFYNSEADTLRRHPTTGVLVTSLPASLTLDGRWGLHTRAAMQIPLLYGVGLQVSDLDRLPTVDTGFTTWLQSIQTRMPPNANSWTFYDAVQSAPPSDVMRQLEDLAYNFADNGISGSSSNVPNLPPEAPRGTDRSSNVPSLPEQGSITAPTIDNAQILPEADIYASPLQRRIDPLWYWAIGAGALVVVGGGLALMYKRKRSRRRR